MRILNGLVVPAILAGVACAPTGPRQPEGAPPPDRADQMLVDTDGCTWWVVGNAQTLIWAPRTGPGGDQLCDGFAREAAPEVEATPGEMVAAEIIPAPPIIVPASVAAPTPSIAPLGNVFVQVASFRVDANATASSNMFTSLGLPVDMSTTEGGINQLRLGPFADTSQANQALAIAKREGFGDAFITGN